MQHYLLSPAAKTLSIAKVARMTVEEAAETFRMVRWSETGGEPVCPRCACTACYPYRTRPVWRCKSCEKQFSVTAGTIFQDRKMPIKDILLAIALFANSAKGHSALQLSRDLQVRHRTAFRLLHKIREALGAQQAEEIAQGQVEIDGLHVGGHVRPSNRRFYRRDRRLAVNRSGKRRVVIVMRERGGKTLPFVVTSEDQGAAIVAERVAEGSTIFADEAAHWDQLHARFLTKRINHTEAYAQGETSTNQAESFFSRIRRSEMGVHHRISGPHLGAYASEMAWREDNRRVSNGEQYLAMVGAALKHPISKRWRGY